MAPLTIGVWKEVWLRPFSAQHCLDVGVGVIDNRSERLVVRRRLRFLDGWEELVKLLVPVAGAELVEVLDRRRGNMGGTTSSLQLIEVLSS